MLLEFGKVRSQKWLHQVKCGKAKTPMAYNRRLVDVPSSFLALIA